METNKKQQEKERLNILSGMVVLIWMNTRMTFSQIIQKNMVCTPKMRCINLQVICTMMT